MVDGLNLFDLNRINAANAGASGAAKISQDAGMDKSIFAKSDTDIIEPEKYLDIVLGYQDVLKEVDINGDGEIDDAEKQTFIEKIKGNDGDETSVSNKDIAMELEEIMEKAKAEKEAQEKALAEEAAGSPSSEGAAPMGSSGAMGAGEGSNPFSDLGLETGETQNLEGMTMEELQEEKENREANLDAANEQLTEAQENYDKAVEQDEQLDQELKERQEANQKAIDGKQQEIANTQNSIVEKEDAISDKESQISDLESQIPSLEQAANAPLPPATITVSDGNGKTHEEPNPEYEPAKQAKEEAQQQLEEKKQELEQAQKEIETMKKDLQNLETQLKTQQGDLAKLEQERTQIEMDFMNSECSDAVKEALQALNQADKIQYNAQNDVFEVDRKIAQEKNNKPEEA